MDVFKEIKAQVSIRDFCRAVGIPLSRSNKTSCPMHTDKTPSLSIQDNRFKCFSCGAGGSIIDFGQFYFRLASPLKAAELINSIMGLNIAFDKPLSPSEHKEMAQRLQAAQKQKELVQAFETWERQTFNYYCDLLKCYNKLLLLLEPFSEPWSVLIWLKDRAEFRLDVLQNGTPQDKLLLCKRFTKAR